MSAIEQEATRFPELSVEEQEAKHGWISLTLRRCEDTMKDIS